MNDFKTCRCCKKEKTRSEFSPEKRNLDRLKSYCKPCVAEKIKAYRATHVEETLEMSRKSYSKNRESRRAYSKEYYQRTIEERRAYGREYRKRYLAENKDKVNAASREYLKARRTNNPVFKVICNLRRRLSHLLNGSKSKTTMQLIGCDTESLRKHLEDYFTQGMTWENYGEWHVDHVHPLSKVDLTNANALEKVSHFSNLRPMWAADNIRKSNKVA